MAYVTPVLDRQLSDITGRTAKAFINVADWERIYGNAQEVNALVVSTFGKAVAFDTLTAPTIDTIPTVAEFNVLLANIERIRLNSNLPAITGLVEIKYDWIAGSNEDSPDYLTANSWEQVLDIVYNAVPIAADYWIPCGVAASGQPRFWQHRFR